MSSYEILIPIGAAVGVIMFFSIAVVAFRRRSARLPWEKEENQVSTYHVGMTCDSGNISTPMVRCTLYREACVLSSIFGIWNLPHAEIDSVEQVEGRFSQGLRIRHGVSEAPDRLVLWTRESKKLATELRSLIEGYRNVAPNQRVERASARSTVTQF